MQVALGVDAILDDVVKNCVPDETPYVQQLHEGEEVSPLSLRKWRILSRGERMGNVHKVNILQNVQE